MVQDIADQYLRDRSLTPVLQAVIGGKFAQQIICKGLPYRSEKEEEFYQVLKPFGRADCKHVAFCFDRRVIAVTC